jgi:Glucosidase II beta subunit-like
MRKRRNPNSGAILPHYSTGAASGDDDGKNGLENNHLRRGKRRSWSQSIQFSLVCCTVLLLSLIGLGEVAMRLHTDDDDEDIKTAPRHKKFLHRAKNFYSTQRDASTNHWIQHSRKKQLHPNQSSFQKFQCPIDGKMGYLNDDYCDCTDGSDEPNTSACSNRLVQRPTFTCKGGGGKGAASVNNATTTTTTTIIFASRVGDGIRDCPDGSDEDHHVFLAGGAARRQQHQLDMFRASLVVE